MRYLQEKWFEILGLLIPLSICISRNVFVITWLIAVAVDCSCKPGRFIDGRC